MRRTEKDAPVRPRRREAAPPAAPAAAAPSQPSAPSRPPKRPTGTGASPNSRGTSRLAAELAEWKWRRSVPAETKVFSITGNFPGIRSALLDRGWVENEDKTSRLWDFKYALWQRDIGELGELDDAQVVNYYARNSELTSKAGLCNNLYSCCTLDRVDVDSFFPRCYDLTSQTQVEHFVEDFKVTTCLCLLKRFVKDGGHTQEGSSDDAATGLFPRAAVATALTVCRRRCIAVDQILDEGPQAAVAEAEWRQLEGWSLKRPGRPLKPWAKPARGAAAKEPSAAAKPRAQAAPAPAAADDRAAVATEEEVAAEAADDGALSDCSDAEDCHHTARGAAPGRSSRDKEDEALFVAASEALEAIKARHPQFNIDGLQNIWVLKPAGKSRGRGIQLSARLEKILEVGVGRGAEARWIAQKYIEAPLIIKNKKFDMRQWVLVTRFNPLGVWFYQDCYVRFSFADYDTKKLKNVYAHLTNNSISKHAEDFDEQKNDTMWHSDQLREHLAGLGIERDGKVVKDPWLEIVQPQMKQIVLWSLESVQDTVMPRTNSFELFGYDFMISEDLQVWLIEVNSSPDLSHSTSTTKVLVKAMLEDFARVLVDIEKFGVKPERPKKKWGSCKIDSGRYELLEPARRRRAEKHGRIRKDAAHLGVQGTAVQLRRPRRGECAPGGTDAPDGRYDALALLAAAEAEEGQQGAAADGGALAASTLSDAEDESEASSSGG